jgi:hypothetical protein
MACGYKACTWPTDSQNGGPGAYENALGSDLPGGTLTPWISPNQHVTVSVDGRPHHVVILPDFDSSVVNVGGNHSIRGDHRDYFVLVRRARQIGKIARELLRELGTHGIIESSDEVRMWNDNILVQTGSWSRVKGTDAAFTALDKHGLIRVGKGKAQAAAIVTDDVLPDVIFANFLHPSSPANSWVHHVPNPIINRYRFELGKAQLEKIGESPYMHSLEEMSFKPRTVTAARSGDGRQSSPGSMKRVRRQDLEVRPTRDATEIGAGP